MSAELADLRDGAERHGWRRDLSVRRLLEPRFGRGWRLGNGSQSGADNVANRLHHRLHEAAGPRSDNSLRNELAPRGSFAELPLPCITRETKDNVRFR